MKDIYHLTVEVEAHDQNDFPDEDELANGITEGLPKEWFDDDIDGDRYAVVRIEPWAPGKPLAKARAFLRQEQRLTEHLTGKVEELESTIDDRDRYTLELQADKAVLNESLRMQVEASKVYIGERDHLQQRVDDLVKCNDTQFGIIGSQNARVEENDKLSAQNRTLTIIAQNNGVYINEAKVELDEKRAEIAGLENALIEQ
ncbi:MAG: hypothetical protein M3094_05300, partial [Actinomycetia bacterium]|nr:hypothetical protein [Actinomycetes bacterium]